MKKQWLSIFVGAALSAAANFAQADNLLDVYQMAQSKDPTLNRAKALKEAAFQGISISRANLLPQISASVNYTNLYTESAQVVGTGPDGRPITPIFAFEQENVNWGARMDLSIFNWANWEGLSRAEKVAQQSDTDLAVAKQDLIVRTTRAYLAVLRAMDNVEFVQAEKRAIERQLEQTKQRFEVGLTAITDVHEAQADFDNTVAQEIRAKNDVELRLEELREITGKYHGNISVLKTDRFDAPRPAPERVDEWLTIAEAQSLDLLSRRIGKDIANKDIDLARAGRYPTLDFNVSGTRNDTDQRFYPIGEQGGPFSELPITETRRVGASLSIPIYTGGRINAQVKQAKHNYVVASEDLELTYRSTVRSVRSSYNDVTANISTIRALQQSVVSAESALKATEAGFEVGTRTIVDVLQSTRNLYDAKRNLAGARYDYIQSVVDLKRAAGNLTEEDLAAINKGLGSA